MRTKRIPIQHAPQVEFAAEIGAAFNLYGEKTADGWTLAAEQKQAQQDRDAAARRQADMFPDVYQPTQYPHRRD